MPERSSMPRWAVGIALVLFGLGLYSLLLAVRVDVVGSDPRPAGSVDDILALPDRPDLNVLFVLIDTLRADRLGSYGYVRDTSPALDRIAASGVRFDRHLAQSSWTKCSMASLWSSLYPTRNGVTRFDDVIPEDALLPAEILRDSGFRTVGIYRNGWVSDTFGFSQGFDAYIRPVPARIPPNIKRRNPTVSDAATDESVTESALEFLRVDGHERWFLYLHLMDLHEYLYDEESALFGNKYSDIYDNSIRWTDKTLEIFFETLAAKGYLENTLVIITSDHGEAFQERGFEGHARMVYRESTEVPFIVSFPFRLDGGAVVPSRSRGVDVWPTILDLLGVEVPAGLDGRSMLPELLASVGGDGSPELAAEPVAISYLDQSWGKRDHESKPTVAVSDGPLRYVRVSQPPRVIEQLFDRDSDPDELKDLSTVDPESVDRLRGVADGFLDETPVWGEVPTKELGELELNQLRALGYAVP